MAQLIIKLVIDATTGKKNVIIGYESDSDALPMEHEEDHRRIVDRLIEGGALKASELGQILVERVEEKGVAERSTVDAELELTEGAREGQSVEQDQ